MTTKRECYLKQLPHRITEIHNDLSKFFFNLILCTGSDKIFFLTGETPSEILIKVTFVWLPFFLTQKVLFLPSMASFFLCG